MKSNTFALWLIVANLILVVTNITTSYQRNTAIWRYQVAEATIEADEVVFDQWETFYQSQGEIIGIWNAKRDKLEDDIRAYKAMAEALEGRLQKMASVYRSRELELLEKLEELHGQHNQSETWSGISHTESPGRLLEDTGMGCGSDARKCFPTRYSRFVPFQKRIRSTMGRR